MTVDTDAEQSQEAGESQTSTSSFAIDRAMQAAWRSMASSQESQSLPQPSPTEILQSLPSEMDLDEPWQSQAALETQSLLLSSGSSSSQFSRQELEPGKNYVSMADSAMTLHFGKRALHQIAEDELAFQSSSKRPRMTLDLSEYDADGDDEREESQPSAELPRTIGDLDEYDTDGDDDKGEDVQPTPERPHRNQDAREYDADSDDHEEPGPTMQGDKGYRCPCCLKSYSTQRALTRHRHSITQLKCLDLDGVRSLPLFLCSERGCQETNDRRDAMERHVRRKHGYSYIVSAATTKHFPAVQLREMMKNA